MSSRTQAHVEHATRPLEQIRVDEAMHRGVITCPVHAPLRDVARMMSEHRVHAIVVRREGEDGEGLWGVVSDLDLVAAASAGELEESCAGLTAGTPVVLVAPADKLARAAQLMREHELAHLVVADPATGQPVGVLSTLDLATAIAG
jgi:CBS domain-containing protein